MKRIYVIFLKNIYLEIGEQCSADEAFASFENDFNSIDRYDENLF
jgi:hypothetical protein